VTVGQTQEHVQAERGEQEHRELAPRVDGHRGGACGSGSEQRHAERAQRATRREARAGESPARDERAGDDDAAVH
jgi:hypothetical protein